MTNDCVNRTIALLHWVGTWEPLKIERKKAKAKMIYKVFNKMGPQSLTKLFSYKSDKTDQNIIFETCQVVCVCLPKPRTDNMKNSFMYDGSKLWDSIAKDIRESKSLSAKNRYSHLLVVIIVNKLSTTVPLSFSNIFVVVYILAHLLKLVYLHLQTSDSLLAHAPHRNQLRLTGSACINKKFDLTMSSCFVCH